MKAPLTPRKFPRTKRVSTGAEAPREIDCQIRGLSPAPGAWTEAKGERLKILYAEPVDGKAAPGDGDER